MRENKVRIWDKENKKFWEDINEAYNGRIEQLLIGRSGDLFMRKMDGMYHESTFPDRFEQSWYTGLKDKNGKESCHKDIVEFEGILYSVEWDEKDTGFYLADLVYLDDPDSEDHKIGSCISESVIKGNPWEHPHLLEGRESIPKEDTKDGG